MTNLAANRLLLAWLKQGLDVLELYLDPPQSLLEPRTAPQPPEPMAEPKRKRGRPRKKFAAVAGIYTPEQIAVLDAIQADRVTAQEKANEQASKAYNCSYCGRVLPVAVRELHEANCRAAAVGYATHVAQPGKGGSELG